MIDQLLEAILGAPRARRVAAKDGTTRARALARRLGIERHDARHQPRQRDASAVGQERDGEGKQPQLERGPQLAASAGKEVWHVSDDSR